MARARKVASAPKMPKRTTIILGAGASADFGMPLGGGLFGDVRAVLAGFRAKYRSASDRQHFFYSNDVRNWAHGDEFATQMCDICKKPDGSMNFSSLFDLVDMMDEAPAYTIDTLALERPEFTEICRVATAEVLIKKIGSMIEGEPHQVQKWLFCSRELKEGSSGRIRANWMTLFVTAMRGLLRQGSDEKFCFISFNYDKIAENGMQRIWNNASNTLGSFDDHVEFTYPHGFIDWAVDGQWRSRFSVAKSPIVFAHNKTSSASFDIAAEWIASSERVISLGFNFSPENVKSLQLKKGMKAAELVYQNFDQNPGLDRRIAGLEISQTRGFSGGISEAILRGELGELPT